MTWRVERQDKSFVGANYIVYIDFLHNKKIEICVILIKHMRLSVEFEKLSTFLINLKLLMWRKRYER
jgi:hypothetical protein